MSQQNLLFVVISIFSAPESLGVREEISDLRWSEPESVLSVTLRARAGADWSQRRLRARSWLRLADVRGRGNGMRYEMVYTRPHCHRLISVITNNDQ